MTPTAPSTAAPLLSLITVTWNHREELDGYLAAIERCRATWRDRLELVIVDNASADDTAGFLAQRVPWANVIRNGVNAGFAEGCNIGLAAARGDFLMLLNPDAEVNDRALSGMIRFLRRNPRVGAVGCQLLHDDGLPQISAYPRITASSYLRNSSIAYPLFERLRKLQWKLGLGPKGPVRCGWLMGACVVVPRAVYQRVGGMDATYFMYSEDADWCERINQAGRWNVYLPQLTMRHRQKGSSRRAPEFTFRRLYRSALLYANKNLRGTEYAAFVTAMAADMIVRLPVYAAYSLIRPERRARLGSVWQLLRMVIARDPNLITDAPPR
jgi:hypothetical protein